MKRIFCIAFISILCTFSFLTGYCSLYSVPVYGAQDQWETLTSNEQLVDAFRAYCKSRNTVIDGSLLDAVTSFTTTTFNNICNTLGIDITLLQAELQRSYTGSGYKYAFSQLGLSTYNRIFAEFLQNNDLAVGDSADEANNTVYSGEYFQDADGYGCLIWDMPAQANTTVGVVPNKYGSTYKYDYFDIDNIYNHSVNPNTFTFRLTQNTSSSYSLYFHSRHVDGAETITNAYTSTNLNSYQPQYVFGEYINGVLMPGSFIIYRINNSSTLYFGKFLDYSNLNRYPCKTWHLITSFSASNDVITNTNIYITTNNQTINNETVINEGDTYIIDSDGEPGGGGSGGGSDDDDWNPVLPDVPGAGSDPSGGNTIDWPDLDLPDFDLSNFSLGDLRLKFPFSIPFDIVSILGVINAPAVAPVIQEDIPIRIDLMNVDYTIPINLDMSDSLYDNFAVLVRAVEFIGFCIGLIHLTIRLVKG